MINLSPPGARGSGFIVPSSEREPLDQTDIDWTVILDPLGRWNVVCEKSPDWSIEGGGRPGPQGGRPRPGPFQPLLRSRGFSVKFSLTGRDGDSNRIPIQLEDYS